MKKRLLAFLLAVSIAVSMLVMPASAAGNNTAVQFAITLGAMDSEQSSALDAAVTRGAFARMLTSYSTYRESVSSQGAVGTLYTDLPGSSAWAPYVRIAVQQGWMNGYTDGSFRPNNAVTLEEACTAVLKLMGYKMTDLSGAFPNAQLNKASEIGLRAGLDRRQGEAMNYEDCAVLLYNALTANNASGSAYGTTLGFTVSNGQVDGSTILLSSLEGPFVASESTVLPFVPASVYRNDKVSGSAELNKYDVYYYSESLKTLWVYTRRAAGRITEVSPSASAPASITVAGTSYTLGSTAIASQVSSLNGGGVGQVVTLLLGMNDAAVSVLTGDAADAVFYGVVQSSSRTLVETNSAEVQQAVSVMCTDGTARTVNVNNKLNFPAGKLVEMLLRVMVGVTFDAKLVAMPVPIAQLYPKLQGHVKKCMETWALRFDHASILALLRAVIYDETDIIPDEESDENLDKWLEVVMLEQGSNLKALQAEEFYYVRQKVRRWKDDGLLKF